MRRWLAVLAFALATPASAAFLDQGAGARAPGMGDAFTAVADDLYSVYYNPAGLAQIERPQMSAMYSKLYWGLSDGSDLGTTQLTYAQPLKNGRWGGLGASLQRFELRGAYQESSLYASWGNTVLKRGSGSRLMAGISAKYLQHGFTPPPEAANACNQGLCSLGPDPVLSGPTSKGTPDADIGFLYRFPAKYQVGAFFQHVMRPDVGFQGPDKLPLNIRIAGAYKSLWLNLVTEARLEPAPDGSTDKDLIFAAEKFIPTLEHGTFGMRGSIGAGSRDWRQLTLGVSYLINKIEVDYAFLMPIGTVQGTMGTQKVDMTFRFGTPTPEEDLTQDLLEQQKESHIKSDFGLTPHDLDDPRLVEVKREVDAGRFRRGYTRLQELIAELPPDPSLLRLSNRLRLVSNYYPQFTAPREKWEKVLIHSLNDLIRGKDHAAVLQISYAVSLNPSDAVLSNFLGETESLTGTKGERVAPDSGRDLLQEMLYRMEMYHNEGQYKKVFATLEDIETIDPENPTALERAGSTYYVLSRYADAISAWKRALPLETRQKEVESIRYYIDEAQRRMTSAPAAPQLPAVSAPPAAPAAVPQPAVAPARQPAVAPAVSTPTPSVQETAPSVQKTAPSTQEEVAPVRVPQVRRGDPRDVPELYQRGVEHYARGEYLQAEAMFTRILQIDPENAQAQKALERIRLKSAGPKP